MAILWYNDVNVCRGVYFCSVCIKEGFLKTKAVDLNMDKKYNVLNRINSPQDLAPLSEEELSLLAGEIRDFLVENVSVSGGHLASNLGVVELTLALHRVLNTPKDHIIWDVGHQSYVHKILTGRRESFQTIRSGGGLSGFTCRSESEHDCFGAGHSSTSLSAAIGFAKADKLCGSDAVTVAVVGDGAFTGGMIHEALNNCDSDLPLIMILNENEMSISKNIGHFAQNISKLRSGKRYLKTKKATRNFIKKIPLIGDGLFRFIRNIKKSLKNAIFGSNYFEDMGLYYLGPVDGHDIPALERLLREAVEAHQSTLIHVKTVKGKGYEPAENDPNFYHAMPKGAKSTDKKSFSEVFGETLCELAENDSRICAITAAMASGTGLDGFAKAYPDRFFDVGIAEEHALTFAAGLAANKMKPVAAIYSTFLQRGYDNIIHDIALQELPVTLCIDRAGLNAGDGPTHHGIFDVAFLSEIPGITVFTPSTAGALHAAMQKAAALDKPCAVRYPKGYPSEEIERHFYPDGVYGEPSLRADFCRDDSVDAVIITDGVIVTEAMKAKAELEGRINVGIMLLECIKPYENIAVKIATLLPRSAKKIIFLEEEIRNGGMGMVLSDTLRRLGAFDERSYSIIATENAFVRAEKGESIYKTAGVSAEDICKLLEDR